MTSSRSASVSRPKPVVAKIGALKAGTPKVSVKVQILKAILHRHFPSKEDLAVAAMVRGYWAVTAHFWPACQLRPDRSNSSMRPSLDDTNAAAGHCGVLRLMRPRL